MEFELIWNPTVSNELSVGYDHSDGVSISVGGLRVAGATIKIINPDQNLHNWQFGYVQNLLCAKNVWIYRDSKPPERITKEAPHQCLDQERDAAGFFFIPPVKTQQMQTHRLSLPEFKDYPRTYGESSFNRVFGTSVFVLWIMAFNTATKKIKILDHRYWQIFFDVQKDPHSDDNIIASSDTAVTFRHEGSISRPPVRLSGPRANSSAAQRITRSIFVNGNWQDAPEEDDSDSDSSQGSSEASDDDSDSSLETETIDASKLEIPPGLRDLGPFTY
ncbi:hypothetical protein SAMN03159511_2492 [Pseudomonas sp. NFACC19-2]|nr:hypothetical protein [Pseudomonas sp. NFACC19-2]SFW33588.1 hypothetical protein SAMN03159511_2492 [Pseudomonas sp. NFACC19-2]